jgi:hypothetical protein
MAQNIPERLPQIGPATLTVLRSRGIRTNLDVLYRKFPWKRRSFGDGDARDALNKIPGIGHGREAILREWAQRVSLSHDERKQLDEARTAGKPSRSPVQAEQQHRADSELLRESVTNEWSPGAVDEAMFAFLRAERERKAMHRTHTEERAISEQTDDVQGSNERMVQHDSPGVFARMISLGAMIRRLLLR